MPPASAFPLRAASQVLGLQTYVYGKVIVRFCGQDGRICSLKVILILAINI
jgi:hypothetical protein